MQTPHPVTKDQFYCLYQAYIIEKKIFICILYKNVLNSTEKITPYIMSELCKL